MPDWILLSAPFLTLILLSIWLRLPLWKAALAAYAVGVGLTLWKGGFDFVPIPRSMGQGLLTAIELAVILFGAIFFLHFLKAAGAIEAISRGLEEAFKHPAEQVLVLVWLFGSFIEGCSGFGTPALIVAPMLASMGMGIQLAVVVSLLANTAAVTFGAVGTPIQIGFSGLDTTHVAVFAAGINLVVACLVPVWIIRLVQADAAWLKNHPPLPLSRGILHGLAFLVPYFAASFFGSNFPSLIGGVVGLAFLLILRIAGRSAIKPGTTRQLFAAFAPYLILTALLLGGRLLLGRFAFRVELPGGAAKTYSAFQPGLMYFLAALIVWSLQRQRFSPGWSPAIRTAFASALRPFFVILFLASLAHHTLLLEKQTGVVQSLAQPLNAVGLAALTPWIGAFGSFVAGSATVSNLLFGAELAVLANITGASVAWILALQLVGAGVGNALAFQNLVAVQAAIRSEGMEVPILRRLLLPCLLYLVSISIIGWIVQMLFSMPDAG
jgi:lactate permease